MIDLKWLSDQKIATVKARGKKVWVTGFFPSPEQHADLIFAIVSGGVADTPWGPRNVVNVTATDGPDGWSATLATPSKKAPA